MTRTAISPRLATRTFVNMRREDYSVAQIAAALRARALDHEAVDAPRPPAAHPRACGRHGPVGRAARPAPALQRGDQVVALAGCATFRGGDQRRGAGAERLVGPAGGAPPPPGRKTPPPRAAARA